jgi:phosphoserine phosphatase
VALFPPDDGTLGFWPVEGADRKATLPYYENSFEAVKRLSLAHEGLTIFKPHPSFLEKTFDTTGYPNLHVVDYDFRRVMEWADIVASTGTGLEFVAAGMGKPVLLMANDIFAGKSIAYEAQDPVDLPMAIAQAQANTDAAERNANFQAFTGYLMKDFLISPRDANPGFRQPVDVVRDLIRDYLPAETKTHSSHESMPDRYPVLSREWANKLKVDTKKENDRQMELRGQPLTDRGILFRTLKRGEGTHLVLDFDYTLFKNNSTDSFLKMLRPAWLAFFLITVSDTVLKNLARWKLANYERWRDFFRVAITSLFFPWKVYFWRKRAAERMKELGNHDLIETVLAANPSKVTVISFGFEHLVRPLVEQIPFQAEPEIICSRIWPKPFNLRKKGKVEALRPSLPPDRLTEAVFVTDSHDDKDLLGYIPNSFLLQWGEYSGKPHVGVYFPLRYTLEGKYPARRYLWNQLFKEEFLLLLLAYDLTISSGSALVFLFLSLMTVYDAGYYENDHLASKKEKQPNVSPQSLAFTKYSLWPAVIWVPVFVLAAFGLFSLGGTLPLEGSIADRWLPGFQSLATDGAAPWLFPLGLWFVFLVLLWGVFKLFNRIPPFARIFLFPFLHTLKIFGYGLILPLTHLGGVLLASQVLIQTITYNIYRHGGAIDKFNRQAYRLVVFMVILVPLWLTSLSLREIVCDWRFVLILLWGGYRALERQYGAGFVKGGIKKAIRLWKEFWRKRTSSSTIS